MDVSKNEEPPQLDIKLINLESSPKEEAIRVCTRMRPLFEKEINSGHLKAWKMQKTDMHLIVEPPSMSEMLNARDPKKGNKRDDKKKVVEKSEGQKAVVQRHYVFDRCFDDYVGNEEVYKILARDIILDAFKGINGCILAYGQTGSGKTHSVMGVPTDPGMLPRSLAEFFDVIENPSILKEDTGSVKSDSGDNNTKEFLMRVTYLEVYMERVNDLLQEGYRGGAVENLDVKEDPKRGFVVIGVQEETVTSIDEVMLLVAKAEQRRHIAQTNFNETSSRSHTIFTVLLESNQIISDGTSINKRGELKIVDLAGNERAGRAAEGMENSKTVLEEGKAINKSLFVLSEVISKLSKRAQALASGDEKRIKKHQEDLVFIPWRDSKLTRILSKSLGGNCRASVIVAVHPSHLYLDTSFSTLRFALKCKTIKKKIEVNFLSPEQSVIMQQKELIAKLQNQLKHLATSKNIDPDYPGTDRKYHSARKPDDDEKVLALKKELEEKVKKFQNFILKSEFHVKTHNNYRALRSIDTMTEKSLKYSMTMSGNLHNELTWLRSFGTHEYDSKWDGIDKYDDQNNEENINITKAMNYLKNKSPYEEISSVVSETNTENSENIDENISINYYNELEQLEKLEKDAIDKVQKKMKTSGASKTVNKEIDDMAQSANSKEGNFIEDEEDENLKKKEKSKKKVNKISYDVSVNNTSGTLKKIDRGKFRGKASKSLRLKKVKVKKEPLVKGMTMLKLEGNTKNHRQISEVSKEGYEEEEYEVVYDEEDEEDGEGEMEGEREEATDGKKKVSDVENLTDQKAKVKEITVNGEQEIAEDAIAIEQKEQDINEVRRTSIISNLKHKIVEDLKKKKKIYDRNVELNKQIKFIMKLMHKVGLSALLTGTVPPGRNVENVLQLRENLKEKLKLADTKRSIKTLNDMNFKSKDKKDTDTKDSNNICKDNNDMFKEYLDCNSDDESEKNNVATLSHAFINEMFCSFLLRLHQKNTNDETFKELENEITQEDEKIDVSTQSLEEILGANLANEVKIIEDSINAVNINSTKKNNKKGNTSHAMNKYKCANPNNNVNAAINNDQQKENDTIESILNLLTPSEQKILALLYEQQKMRNGVQELKKKFADRIKNINIFIKKILIDKVEVEEHFKRVLETIKNYKNDLIKSCDVDSNFKFANLMKKLEDVSISLAEKTRDFNVLAEFHINLRKTLKQKENLIKELQEENKLFYLVPRYHELLKNLEKEEETNEHVKELKKEFLRMYGRLIMTKKKLEEKEVIEKDMRNLNTKIYTELVESISVIKNLESQYKFLEFKTNKENKKKGERIRRLIGEKLKLNKVINEMERMLQEANINADGLKDNIITNYEVPEVNTDLEEEEGKVDEKEDEEEEKEKEKEKEKKEKEKEKEQPEDPNKKKNKLKNEEKKKKEALNGNILEAKKKKKVDTKIRNNNMNDLKASSFGKNVNKNEPLKANLVKKPKINLEKLNSVKKNSSISSKNTNDGIKIVKQKKNAEVTLLKAKAKKKKLQKNIADIDQEEDNKSDKKQNIKNNLKKKKLTKSFEHNSDDKEEKAEKSSTNSQLKKKKDKKKLKLTKKNLKAKLQKEKEAYLEKYDNENDESHLISLDNEIETNDIRKILTMEIEKKKKIDAKHWGNINGRTNSADVSVKQSVTTN